MAVLANERLLSAPFTFSQFRVTRLVHPLKAFAAIPFRFVKYLNS